MPTAQPKTAVITGAAGTLGRALCRRLARDGWQLAITDIDLPRAESVLDEVRALGGDGIALPLDVTDRDQWCEIRDRLQSQWPRLDLLVNNAGIGASGTTEETSLDVWQTVLDVNLLGAVHGCQVMLPWLKDNADGGHILNTASYAGLLSPPSMAAYNVSKAGVIALSETLHGELENHNVGVTVLCPGFFSSGLIARGRFQNRFAQRIGLRLARKSDFTADDIAERAVTAMAKNQLYVVHGRRARWLWRLKRLWPGSYHKLTRRSLARYMQKVEAAEQKRTTSTATKESVDAASAIGNDRPLARPSR